MPTYQSLMFARNVADAYLSSHAAHSSDYLELYGFSRSERRDIILRIWRAGCEHVWISTPSGGWQEGDMIPADARFRIPGC